MAAKKKSDAPGKTDFVRGQSNELPAGDVVALAKSAGLELTNNEVHSIRAKLRQRQARAGKSTAKSASGKAKKSKKNAQTAAPNEGTSKSDFVRSLPDASPAEISARAKDAGLDITPKYVSTVRSGERVKKAKAAKAKRAARKAARLAPAAPSVVVKKAAAPPPPAKPASRAAASSLPSLPAKQFTALVLDLGIRHAKELLARIEAKAETFSADA